MCVQKGCLSSTKFDDNYNIMFLSNIFLNSPEACLGVAILFNEDCKSAHNATPILQYNYPLLVRYLKYPYAFCFLSNKFSSARRTIYLSEDYISVHQLFLAAWPKRSLHINMIVIPFSSILLQLSDATTVNWIVLALRIQIIRLFSMFF